ncbi:protein BYPASS1-LIKE-like [Musa acuminata AAA Group]|uniref:protein BYPASS1-LIKE-like n=1 Tax=Musa acuminata AAA Group TaxID=214697 RepID=UPI0031D21508
MPVSVYQGFPSSSSVSFVFLGRSIRSIRADSVRRMNAHHHMATAEQQELCAFQRCVADHFMDLSAVGADGLLSLSWVHKLLHAFLVCHEEFRALLVDRWALIALPPLEHLIADFSDRAVKALDICNAARDGVNQLRRLLAQLEIVVAALGPAAASTSRRRIGEGQLRRSRKALGEVAVVLDDKDAGSILSHSNRSFVRSGNADPFSSPSGGRRSSHFRSTSSTVSRSWSAARQLQAIGSNTTAPRGHEVDASAGLAVPIYTMTAVLLFSMHSLVAAIPCRDRGLQAHFSVPRTFPWSAPIVSLHMRIMEESKKKDRRNSAGLLKEIQQIERCTHQLSELLDTIQLPMSEEEEKEVRQRVGELSEVCDALKDGLDPLERQVREVFLRIVRSHTESLDCLSHTAQ